MYCVSIVMPKKNNLIINFDDGHLHWESPGYLIYPNPLDMWKNERTSKISNYFN